MSVTRWLMLSLLLVSPIHAATPVDPELRRFPGEVRVLLPLDEEILVAGPGPAGKTWFALLDRNLGERLRHVFEDCGRCSILGGTSVGEGRVLLAGSRDPRAEGLDEGWALLIDVATGDILRERLLRQPAGGRFLAAAAGYGRLLLAGEMFTDAGAGLDAWLMELDPRTLDPLDEWRLGGPLPDAAAAVLPVAGDAFLAAGWSFSAETGVLGGWIARFGPNPRPVWKTVLDGPQAFDVAGLLRIDGTSVLALGHESRPDEATRSLFFDLRAARIDIADGRLRELLALREPETDRMGVAMLAGAGTALALAMRQRHPDGPDAVELLSLSPTAGFRSLEVWRDGNRATAPSVMAGTGDGGLLIGGWYRPAEGEEGPGGWLARFAEAPLALDPPAGDLVLFLEGPDVEGRLRVILENRGMTALEVVPLGPDSVYWLPPGEATPPAIGAMPGRPPEPVADVERILLAAGARLEASLPAPVEPAGLRAAYSPDFTGRGLGRLVVSAPLPAAGE